MARMFITSAEVADLLELPSSIAFLSRRADLEEQGFPLPCPWTARPMKWRRDLVEAWIATQGHPRAVGQRPQLVVDNPHYMARAATA
jgi:hypothetical protein